MKGFYEMLEGEGFTDMNNLKSSSGIYPIHYGKRFGCFSLEIFQENNDVVKFIFRYSNGTTYSEFTASDFKEHIDIMCESGSSLDMIIKSIDNGELGEMIIEGLLRTK